MTAGEKAVGELLLWAWFFLLTFRSPFSELVVVTPRSGESWGSEEKSKETDHSDHLLGS